MVVANPVTAHAERKSDQDWHETAPGGGDIVFVCRRLPRKFAPAPVKRTGSPLVTQRYRQALETAAPLGERAHRIDPGPFVAEERRGLA